MAVIPEKIKSSFAFQNSQNMSNHVAESEIKVTNKLRPTSKGQEGAENAQVVGQQAVKSAVRATNMTWEGAVHPEKNTKAPSKQTQQER